MNKIEWQKPAIDAAIVIVGGTLLKTYFIDKFAAIGNLLANVPVVMGIDTKLLIAGIVALIVAKNYILRQ